MDAWRSWGYGQFIAPAGGGAQFGRAVLAAGDKEEGGAVNTWLTPWQAHRRRLDGPRESRRHGRKARPRGGGPSTGVGEEANCGCAGKLSARRFPVRARGRRLTRVRHLGNSLPRYQGTLPRPPTTGHAAVAFLSPARSRTLSTVRYYLMTVNSALNSIESLTDRANWNSIYSRFCVKPKPSFCSKVIEL